MRKATPTPTPATQPPTRAAIYARVSTVDQDCALQLRELREYCSRRGWQIAGEYVDTGWSGAKASRPELDRAMKDASEHRYDGILVWKLDRFGRSVLNLSEQLAQLHSWGIRFIATSQGLDTDANNPTSRLLLHILAAVAEFEREMIRERVRAGMAAARHKGLKIGRPKATERAPTTKKGQKPQAILDIRRVRRLAKTGKSQRYIADLLGVGKGTIGRVLGKAAWFCGAFTPRRVVLRRSRPPQSRTVSGTSGAAAPAALDQLRASDEGLPHRGGRRPTR